MNKNYFYLFLLISQFFHAQDCVTPGTNPGDTGSVTFTYSGIETNYTTVRALDGNIWLQQNLGSENVAASEFDESAYGDLFQWGRWDDGHQKRNAAVLSTMPSPNNPIGLANGTEYFYTGAPEWWANGTVSDQWEAATPFEATADNGCDPCKALGANWSLPTKDDWTAIIAAETITNVATAFGSNLKLAVAGSKLPSGNFNFTGVRGYYWSKTTSDNDNYAKYLYYSNFIVNENAGSIRGQGLSVRCLKYNPQYCDVSVDFNVEPITNVTFSNINNSSSAIVNETPDLEDFTAITANVAKGNSYTLTVKGNTAGEFEHDIRAFIDWNQNGTFEMDTEYYYANLLPSTGTDDVAASVEITIPETAISGTTKMRIIKDMWNVYEPEEINACLNAYYGQIEEYSVNIQNALATDNFTTTKFTLSPNPTNGIVSVTTELTIANISVYNTIGQLVRIQKEPQIDLSNENSGIYIVRVTFENGSSSIKKIIRQ